MPNFEVFQRRSTPIVTQPMVTIQRRGTISFNQAAFTALGEPLVVELLYDRAARLMGLRAADPGDGNAYQVRKQPKSNSFLVAGQAFTQYYRIDTSSARRFAAVVDDKTLVVDLKRDGVAVTGPRARERA